MMETDEAAQVTEDQSPKELAFLPPPYTYQEVSPPVEEPLSETIDDHEAISKELLRLNGSRLENTATEMKRFWGQIYEEMVDIDEEDTDFLNQSIPPMICKNFLDAEKVHLDSAHIRHDATVPLVLSKISELFVLEMTKRALLSRNYPKNGKPLEAADVLKAISEFDQYDLFAERL